MRPLHFLVFILCACATRSLALKPDRSAYNATPASLGLRAEERRILTSDGVQLASWTILPDAKADLKTVLVLAYGDGGNMSYWLPQAAVLAQAGFTVTLFDYRGFGASDSVEVPAAYLYLDAFATDLEAVCAHMQARFPAHKKVLWGFSMGTLIGTLAWPGLKMDGFFGEGFITDPAAVAQRIAARKKKEVLLPPSAATYATHLAALPMQVRTIAGLADSVTTAEDSRQFSFQKPGRVFLEFNGGHGGGWNALEKDWQGRNGYVEALKSFTESL